ncbi:Ig-like domain-containing protein [Pseudomonas sp. Irchel 3E19]|uniref:Ig-like domain-containing protein n=1 Tax=Pseudomonas sp. Irchel 3E19 TaxID=2008981 RepID=UPI000BA3DFBF|nr:Ig-like domain-containing protein [Pseudomonas sp. Irchel 3E19]
MTTSSSTDITLLRLYPPQILGQTERVKGGADIGLSLTVSQLITDGLGAHVRIDPPISGTLNRGDVVFLWLLGEVAFLSFFTVVDPDAVIWMRLPNGRLDHARINEVIYTIERNSANIATSEPPLKVLFNRFRPALKDRLTVPDGHSELIMVLSPELTNGVGADFVKATVCFSYPYCRAHDVITLKCNGETIHFTVDESLAPQPPNPGSPVPTKVCFDVDRAFLDKAKRLDNKLEFRFTVKDQLHNTVDPDAIWSGGQTVDEDLAGTRLPRAILLEQMADFPGDDEKTIELEKLAGGPLHVIVVTADKRFEAGDSIHFTYIAKIPGQPDVVVPLTGTVEADAFGQKKPCIVKVANDKIPASASVTVTYELRRPNGDLVGNSTPANATVTGAAPIQLTPVVLLPPATNPIDPLNNSTGVTVQATYLQALPRDKALLVVAGATPFLPVTLNPNKQADFRLDAKFLAERLGSDSRIIWQLIRDDKVIAESPEFILTVSAIKPEDPRFPTPTIIAVKDDRTLNLGSFAGGTRMLVAPWRLIAVGQPFWAWCEGTNRNGATVTEEIHNGVPIGSTNNQGGPVSREFLDKLADGSTIRVYVAVNFDGVVNRATRVVFPVRSYTVKALSELILNTTPLRLDGFNISIKRTPMTWVRTGFDPAGTAEKREATGGLPPYRYESDDESIATVDNLGKVRSEGIGSTTITASDSAGQSKKFIVSTANVIVYLYTDSVPVTQIAAWAQSVGGTVISTDTMQNIHIPFIRDKYARSNPQTEADFPSIEYIGPGPGPGPDPEDPPYHHCQTLHALPQSPDTEGFALQETHSIRLTRPVICMKK